MLRKIIMTLKARSLYIAYRLRERGLHSAWICVKAQLINTIVYFKNRFLPADKVECPCCGWKGNDFRCLDCATFIVPHVMCPKCGAHERQRIMHVFLTDPKMKFFKNGGTVLHFAPDRQVRSFLEKYPAITEICADIDLFQYQLRPGCSADLHHLPFPDNIADGLFCQHVLEHVRSDVEALAELHRVLKPGGEAVIMVPFMDHQSETEEYDQPDPDLFFHVRGYSIKDFPDKLKHFDVTQYPPKSLLGEELQKKYCVPDNQVIYLCVKR